jgi:lactate racemase
MLIGHGAPAAYLSDAEVRRIVADAADALAPDGKRILAIIPDGTRTMPMPQMFGLFAEYIGSRAAAFDYLIALGTHQPMTDAQLTHLLGHPVEGGRCGASIIHNHLWANPATFATIGTIAAEEIEAISGGLFSQEVVVRLNKLIFDYDQIVICGPVFPHEVVGFSGGNKYLFPGVAGPGILNFFHWLGAVVTNPMIIGNKWTPVRKVVDRAGGMVQIRKSCLALVVQGYGDLAGLFIGTPEDAWDGASDLSRDRHIIYKDRPFHTVLSCAPEMYDDLWVAGKCMYKLEPIVADGGELIIYAPHMKEISFTHGAHIRRIGYHCRDYILKQWDRFKDEPWGILAHSAHVHGIGTYDEKTGIETPRVRVTLATGLTPAECKQVNLGYRDWRTIRKEDYANREAEGVFLEPKAGERLYHLRNKPAWAGGKV